MPRDSSGVYTLPVGNPVVTNTIISSVWANSTMGDIAAQLNNVLTRDGLLGPTSPFKIVDGTVNAPGLAFNSEPGLGWYREGANKLGFATAGAKVFGMDLSAAAVSGVELFPRTAGQSWFTMYRDPAGTVNTDFLVFSIDNTGSFIGSDVIGTGTKKPVFFGGSQFIFENRVTIDNQSPSLLLNGSAGSLGVFMEMNRPSGAITNAIRGSINGPVRWQLDLGNPDEDFTVSRFSNVGAFIESNIKVANANGMTTIASLNQTATLTVADAGANGANLRFNASGGAKTLRANANNLELLNNAYSEVIATFGDDGHLRTKMGYSTQPGSGAAPGVNNFNIWHSGGQFLYIDATNVGQFQFVSDERIKKNIRPLEGDEEAFMAIKPIEYEFDTVRIWTADGVNRWGFSAQNLRDVLPGSDAVNGTEVPIPEDDMERWGPLTVSDRPILALTVVQVQNLINRVAALEAQ